ncbi:MAG: homoserine kinase [Chloroflexota bacterium]|nr:homoserine kinase [Chloroflexota bacterium]
MSLIKVKSPATTANLGPGFDCLGMAVDIWNFLEVEWCTNNILQETSIEVYGEGSDELATDTSNLVYQAIKFLFLEAGHQLPPLRLRCENNIPLSRGLGSSAAAISSGLVAANFMVGNLFEPNELLEMAATVEGHPDNVAAAILGNLQLVIGEDNHLYTVSIRPPDDLRLVIFVPDVRISTDDARRVLPSVVSINDAVYNASRVGLLVAGMLTDHVEYFHHSVQDKLHQPYREPLFPAMKVIFKAAEDAGALGVFLSGSGSTIMALTKGREMTVAYEMGEAARQTGVVGELRITKPAYEGTLVIDD